MAKNSTLSSQYLLTPITNWYLSYMVPRTIPKNDYDEIVRIPAAFDRRPDLMSNAEYGTPMLWWVFASRNPDLINDPIEDFVSGLEIFVPKDILK